MSIKEKILKEIDKVKVKIEIGEKYKTQINEQAIKWAIDYFKEKLKEKIKQLKNGN